LMFAANIRADVVTYDTTLASPDTNAATSGADDSNLSWYNGSGNGDVQGGWTVDTNNGIELGLRAKDRQSNSVIDTPTDAYVVQPGNQDATHALWNYEFSIDLEPNGVGTLTLSDIIATLTVTDLNTSATNTVNLSTLAGDDSGFGTTNGTTGADRINESPPTLAAFAAGWGAQNSENPEFGNWPLGTFNSSLPQTYQFVLTVSNLSDVVLATDTINVTVAPEPSTFIPLGILAFSLLVWRRRRSVL
jgi:hypothetical protein